MSILPPIPKLCQSDPYPRGVYNRVPRLDLTAEKLHSILHYDPATGQFTWKWRINGRMRPDPRCLGKIAGTKNKSGYVAIGIDGKLYRAGRLAWLYFYGSWPTNTIDHINHDRTDNRICNLRDITNAENVRHRRIKAKRYYNYPKPLKPAQIKPQPKIKVMKNLGLFDYPKPIPILDSWEWTEQMT